jgi:DNA-binding transcriptional regulator GbsR (MarR family)
MKFRISDNLEIDYSSYAVTGMRVSILASSGAGKSNLAALFLEQALDQGVQVCVIEPVEEWRTLKAEFDNVVWVGDEGDIPLEPEMAGAYAKLLEDGASMVLTVSTGDEFRDKDFVASFLWSLYTRWRKVRRPMFIVFEEADVYAPQMWSSTDRLCLSRVATIAKRGRKLGINPIFISQRPADINKSVISQSNINFIGNFNTPQDLESVRQFSKLIHLDLPTEDIARLSPGEFYAVLKGYVYKIRSFLRRTPHGGITPELTRQIRPELASSVEEIRETIEKEMERLRAERNEIERLRRENEQLRKKIQEYEEQMKTLKIIKEVPIEIQAKAPAIAVTSTPQTQTPQLPEPILKSPYPETVKVWLYLVQRMEPVSLKDIRAYTGFSEDRVRRVVRYLRNKGLVKADTAHVAGVGYVIRRVTAKPV